mmetsp:Transcript_17310/g.34720  ORF Transcript_17310/g.34720 Transcript_17310/m.34720 type:complete len:205 (+) Transcript_17310:540-1154(+)
MSKNEQSIVLVQISKLLLSFIYLLVVLSLDLLCSPLRKSCPRPTLLSFSLFRQSLSFRLFTLHCVDSLKQNALVLELVTFGMEVKGVVDVLVDFLRITHLAKKTTEDTNTAHPHDLERKTSVGSTTTLSNSCVTSLSHGLKTSVHTASRVDYRRFFHDETIFFQTSDVATRVGQRNFVDFIWIQPNFTLSAFEYGGREALLKFK